MAKTYHLETLVKDPSVRRTLRKALHDDGKLSYEEVYGIVTSTFDGRRVSYQELIDLQSILMKAKTLDKRSQDLIERFVRKYYHHYLESQRKRKTFNVPYSKDHIPKTTPNSRRPGHAMTPIYLTIHSTGNPRSTARNERNYLTNPSNKRTASYHLVVDQKEVIECIPLNEAAWHAGDGGRGEGNRKTIGLEICESGDRAKTLDNAIALAAKILKERGWKTSKLKRHYDYSGKTCPRILLSAGSRGQKHQTWEWFKDEVGKRL